MIDLLLAPGAPFYALSLAAVLAAAIGALRLETTRRALVGFSTLPARWGLRGRFVLGQAAALPLATVLLLVAAASGTRGNVRLLLLVAAGAIELYVGVVVPRRPLVQAQQERRRLRRLTPGFVSYVRIALAGYDAPATLLSRYVARPSERLLPMQRLIAEALTLMNARRLRPFEAVCVVARARGCQELTDVVEALAQTEREGTDVQSVLAAHAATLEALLTDEFTRLLKRRTLYLVGLSALSVVGILVNLLFVMTGGGTALSRLGG